MNRGLRARAATATLEIAMLAFNPHQRRGPDGRWVKMGGARKRSQQGGTPPKGAGVTAEYDRRQADLARSVASGVRSEKVLGLGPNGETKRVELADGTTAIYKRVATDKVTGPGRPDWTKKDQADAEEMASAVAAVMGVKAPAVHRVSDTEVYMELMPGHTAEDGPRPAGWLETDAAARLGAFDVLIDNMDRVAANWLIDGDEITAIDHGMAFMTLMPDNISNATTGAFARKYINRYGGYLDSNPLTSRDVDTLRGRIEGLRPVFDAKGQGVWVDQMLGRLDRLAANAQGVTDLFA